MFPLEDRFEDRDRLSTRRLSPGRTDPSAFRTLLGSAPPRHSAVRRPASTCVWYVCLGLEIDRSRRLVWSSDGRWDQKVSSKIERFCEDENNVFIIDTRWQRSNNSSSSTFSVEIINNSLCFRVVIADHALHDKGLQRQEGDGSLINSQKR